MTAADSDIDKLEDFFSKNDCDHAERPKWRKFVELRRRMNERTRILADHFGDKDALDNYIKNHRHSTKIRRRITKTVAAKSWAIKKIEREYDKAITNETPEIEKFRLLLDKQYVQPEQIFPEIPPALGLCEMAHFFEMLKECQKEVEEQGDDPAEVAASISRMVIERMRVLSAKWEALTGKSLLAVEDGLDLSKMSFEDFMLKLPRLDELEQVKLPVPLRPAWTNRLYGLEAAKLGHRSAVEVNKVTRSMGRETLPGTSDGTAAEGTSATSETGGETSGTSGSGETGGVAGTSTQNTACATDYLENCAASPFGLYDSDSLAPLKRPGKGDARFTFPEPEKLLSGEEIFYDYSLIMPLPQDDCGPVVEEPNWEPRNPISAGLLAGAAIGLLRGLKDLGLSHVLGTIPAKLAAEPGELILGGPDIVSVADYLRGKLKDIQRLGRVTSCDGYPDQEPRGPSAAEFREIQDQMRELAGVLRTISRTQLITHDTGAQNPADYNEALGDALDEFPYFTTIPRRLPTTDKGADLWYSTLAFPNNTGMPSYDYGAGVRPNAAGFFNVPSASEYSGSWFKTPGNEWKKDDDGGWAWYTGAGYDSPSTVNPGRSAQRFDLRNYIRYLGDNENEKGFFKRLQALKDAADEMRNAVQSFSDADQGGILEQFTTDFEQLASGLLNTTVLALSDILDEIASHLVILPCRRGEGHKRLALQIIYRQHWYPEGYVTGKLLGYKNLLPNQKDTLKQRTFVKTTTETSSLEEFAISRQSEQSASQKETFDIVKESSGKFGFLASASGDYNFGITSGNYTLSTNGDIARATRKTTNRLTESARKTTVSYNNKNEKKIRNLSEIEDVQEVSSEIHNSNAEITANYFYFQLLRQYRVTVDVEDIRPVLLRAREVPTPAEIDEKFLSRYMHVLIGRLPLQLSGDAQESADGLRRLGKTLLRRKATMDMRAAELDTFKSNNSAPDPESKTEGSTEYLTWWREEMRLRSEALSEATEEYLEAEEAYAAARARVDRVLVHLRENITYYMQFIWAAAPNVDQDMILSQETFGDEPLPYVTRGLIRQGYHGNEEVFAYTGQSATLFDHMLEHTAPGSEVCSQLIWKVEGEPLTVGENKHTLAHEYIKPNSEAEPNSITLNDAKFKDDNDDEGIPVTDSDWTIDERTGVITFSDNRKIQSGTVTYTTYEELVGTSLYQYLRQHYPGTTADPDDTTDYDIAMQICDMNFTYDSVLHSEDGLEPVLSETRVQIAQDAMVVETLPGSVPLLEGFQMAHRMLDVQKACLENAHLAERIAGRPWETSGDDTYAVRRYEGEVPPNPDPANG